MAGRISRKCAGGAGGTQVSCCAPPGNYTSRVWEYSSTIQNSDDGPAVQGSSSFSLKGEFSPPCPAFPVSLQALCWPPPPPSPAALPGRDRPWPERSQLSGKAGLGAGFSEHWALTVIRVVREVGTPPSGDPFPTLPSCSIGPNF